MQGIVDYMWQFAPGVSPRYLERAFPSNTSLADRFASRLASLTAMLGEPTLYAELAWYPNAAKAACWRRGEKTLALILENNCRGGAAVLLWCVSDGELATLTHAARTRADRVRAADFGSFVDEQIARIVEPGSHRPLHHKMLLDDLAAIPERARTLLANKISDSDADVRCVVAELLVGLGGGLASVRPLLDDPHEGVRWHVIGLLSGYGDESCVVPLIEKLQSDPDPSVRGQAAFALGHIGSPQAIPYLIQALDDDKECDELGHSPSSISATALDNILGTNETRIKLEDGLCTMASWPPDCEKLKRAAETLYKQWEAT